MSYKIYRNKEELKKQNPDLYILANNHLEIKKNDIICIYDSPEDYAKYLILKGNCAGILIDKQLCDFIDYTDLGVYSMQCINYKKLGHYIIQHINRNKNYYDKEMNIVISITK